MRRSTFFAGILSFVLVFGMTVVSVGKAYAGDRVLWSGAGLEAVAESDGKVYLNDTKRGICLVYIQKKSLYDQAFEVACNGETQGKITSAATLAAVLVKYVPGWGQGASVGIGVATAIYKFWCSFG